MAKTFSLTPKADSSLISAASKASLASAPGDYSTIFQSVSTVYGRTMQAQADAFSQVAQLGGKLAKEIIKNAKETNSIIIEAEKYGDFESMNTLIDEVQENKEQQKALSVFKIGFGNKEQRKERLRLKIEQQELFADIEKIGTTIASAASFIEKGNYDTNISSVHYNELVNAVLKLNHKNKNTENGNRAVLRTNDNGVREFALVKSETGEVVKKQDGNDFTMTLNDFTSHLNENSVDKNNIIGKNFNALDEKFLKFGKNSETSDMNQNMQSLYLNGIDEITKTKGSLARAMLVKHGFDNKNFKETLMSESVVSAQVFNMLLKHYDPTDTDGKINIVGENFLSTLDKNKDGLTQEELNVNYAGFANYIVTMQDEELTRKLFKFNALQKGKSIFAEGYSQGKKTTTNGVPSDGLRLGPMINGQYQQRESQSDVIGFINSLKNGTEIQYQGNEYIFDKDNNQWVENRGIEGVEEKIIGTADDMRRDIFRTSNTNFMNIKTVVEDRIDHKTGEFVEKSDSIADVENEIKTYFENIGMINTDGAYLPKQGVAPGETRISRTDLKNKIESILTRNNIDRNVKVKTSVFYPSAIVIEAGEGKERFSKRYNFIQDNFTKSYRDLIEDLSDILANKEFE